MERVSTQYIPDCEKIYPRITAKFIIGGKKSEKKEFPHMVNIIRPFIFDKCSVSSNFRLRLDMEAKVT